MTHSSADFAPTRSWLAFSVAVALAGLGLTIAAHGAAPSAAIAPSANAITPLAVGAAAPAAAVTTLDGASADLATLVREKPTVLVFYRGSWCPYCNTQLAALGELESELLALGYQILAVTPDSAAGLKAATAKNKLSYRLLSDTAGEASRAFGVAFRVDAATAKKYTGYGIGLAPIPSEPGAFWLPVPAVFLVGRDGVIQFVHTDPDYKKRLAASQLLAAARAVR